jgi:hypothetical protein
MLGKLMKYEFKATGRIYLPLFAALLVVSGVNRLFIDLNFAVPKIIGITVSVIIIVAICVISLIITLQRFYRNLLKDEGYLMFTLPVGTDSLIWSKLLAASVWSVVSFLAVMIAVSIMAMTGTHFRDMLEAFAELFRSIRSYGINGVLLTVEALILAVATMFSSILLLYACMALSLLVNKHRVGFAFLMYIAITTIGQILLAILATIGVSCSFYRFITCLPGYAQIQTAFGLYFLGVAIPGIVFYFLTRYMLKYRLNLE